jgi:hypothetical protein
VPALPTALPVPWELAATGEEGGLRRLPSFEFYNSMAGKYLIECECGAQHAVTTHQAGAELPCGCGKTVAVPRLRELQKLPLESAVPTAVVPSSRWTAGHSLGLAGLVLALLSLAGALWAHYSIRPLEEYQQLVGEHSTRMVDHWLDEASPADLFRVWYTRIEKIRQEGFSGEMRSDERQVQSNEAQLIILRNLGFALAGVGLAMAIAGWMSASRVRHSTTAS